MSPSSELELKLLHPSGLQNSGPIPMTEGIAAPARAVSLIVVNSRGANDAATSNLEQHDFLVLAIGTASSHDLAPHWMH